MIKLIAQRPLFRPAPTACWRGDGFTLIELMIVVAIIAILAAIALPSYTKYVFRSRRAEGQALMMQFASAQERYYTNFNKYATTLSDLGVSGAAANSENGYYTGSILAGATGDSQSYYAKATPAGVQATDACGYLQIDNVGNKTEQNSTESNGKCW